MILLGSFSFLELQNKNCHQFYFKNYPVLGGIQLHDLAHVNTHV